MAFPGICETITDRSSLRACTSHASRWKEEHSNKGWLLSLRAPPQPGPRARYGREGFPLSAVCRPRPFSSPVAPGEAEESEPVRPELSVPFASRGANTPTRQRPRRSAMRPYVLHVLGVVAFATFVTPIPSHAQQQQCSGLAEWNGNDMLVSPPAQRLQDELSYFTFGPALYGVWGESATGPVPHTGGSYKFMFSAGTMMHELGHNLGLCHEGPVTTDDNQDVLFVGSDNGRLYKLDAHTGPVLGFVDLRRHNCPGDKLRGTPAVQHYRFSNPAFQNAILAQRGRPDDLVYVIRTSGCGDPPDNQVIACFASDNMVV